MEDSRGPRRRAALRAAQWSRMSHPPMLFAFFDNRYVNTRVPATAPNQMGIRAAILLPRRGGGANRNPGPARMSTMHGFQGSIRGICASWRSIMRPRRQSIWKNSAVSRPDRTLRNIGMYLTLNCMMDSSTAARFLR